MANYQCGARFSEDDYILVTIDSEDFSGTVEGTFDGEGFTAVISLDLG